MLEQRELSDSVNLVITGLHGYTEVTAGDVVDISNLVSDQVSISMVIQRLQLRVLWISATLLVIRSVSPW